MVPLPGSPPDQAMLDRLFPDEDYGFRMKFQKGTLSDFYDDGPDHAALTEERRKWVSKDPQKYCALEKRGLPLLNEAIQTIFNRHLNDADRQLDAVPLLELLAGRVEPDFLLLTPNCQSGDFELCCGSVCFPSSWSLEEKMGRNLSAIHEPVPGLNAVIGDRINLFLHNMRPGISWNRLNWGLSRSPELNQHPSRTIPRLDDSTPLTEIFLRIEWQSLVTLPTTGILFGIRVLVHPFDQIVRNGRARQGLIRALKTIPQEVAIYKNLWTARDRILEMIATVSIG